jgi:hypothetical protein
MVRALPDQKAHANQKKGAEPPGRKTKDKAIPVEVKPPPSRKKLLKELRVGTLPKTEPPKSDMECEDNNVKMLHEFE